MLKNATLGLIGLWGLAAACWAAFGSPDPFAAASILSIGYVGGLLVQSATGPARRDTPLPPYRLQ